MILRPATAADLPRLASAHAQAFDAPWDEATLLALLTGSGAYALVAVAEGVAGDTGGDTLGMILCRAIGGEAEVLTVGVPPWTRRRGVGQALMTAAIAGAQARAAGAMFLEVDVANAAAVSLYQRLGFRRAGLRKGYYDRGAAPRADALVMRLDLGPGAH